MYEWETLAWRMEAWGLIDKQLCGLVDQLREMGSRHTLEVELRLAEIEGGPGEYDFTKFFPEFEEKGAVTVVNSGQILYSSTHSC